MPVPLPRRLAAEIDAIASDNRSGAMALVERATRAVLESAPDVESRALSESVAKKLVAAQPAMAPFWHLAEGLRNAPDLAGSIALVCRQLLDQIHASDRLLTSHALQLFHGNDVVLTHSYSATAAMVLEAAHRAHNLARVISTESRPLLEGLSLARRLAAAGIRVDITIDAAGPLLVGESTLVLVGADAVTPAGVVNKLGTYAIALAAAACRVPVYAVCSLLKLAPAEFQLPVEQPHAPEEIAAPIPGCHIRNYYFETTPLNLITGVVTEDGLIPAKSLIEANGG